MGGGHRITMLGSGFIGDLHEAAITLAADARKAVLCTKPLALNAGESSWTGDTARPATCARPRRRAPSTAALVAGYRSGDVDASRVWLASIETLARGIASLINILDPEVVIVGGGIANAGDALFGPLGEALARVEWRLDGRGVPIVPAMLGDQAGAIGAARLALTCDSGPFARRVSKPGATEGT